MFKRTFFEVIALSTFVVFSFGCNSIVEDLNDDPNNFTETTLNLSLNQAQLNMASLAGAFPAHIATMWTDQFTGTDRQYIPYDQYGIANNDFDDVWLDIYQRGIVHAQIAKGLANEQSLTSREGIALVMEGYYFGEAASMFGDVPFTQVNQIDEFTDPVYDSQEEVLRAAVALIDQGLSLLDSTTVSEVSSNIFDTDANWAQIANGLKARYLLGLMDYDAAYDAAVASGISLPAQDLEVLSSTTDFGENLWWQFQVEQRTTYLTIGNNELGLSYFQQLLTDTMDLSRSVGDDKTDDAARYAYFIEVGDDPKDGVRFNVSNNGWAAQSANLSILTAAEVQLILAESALLKSSPDKEAAVGALNAARNYWDNLLRGDSYLDYEDEDFDNNEDLRLAILTEKYLSVIGLPTFYDTNRTNNLLGVPSEQGEPIAKRFYYPSTEQSSNSNSPVQVAADLFKPLPLYE